MVNELYYCQHCCESDLSVPEPSFPEPLESGLGLDSVRDRFRGVIGLRFSIGLGLGLNEWF